MTADNLPISPLIIERLPEFIREDHPLFTQFLQVYYNWLDQKVDTSIGYAMERIKNWSDYTDIDNTLEVFVDHFHDCFMKDVPKNVYQHPTDNNIFVDRRKIIKRIKEFHQSRGTERSFEFLFRVLYNNDVSIYYPKVDILRVSDGHWTKEKSIKVLISNDLNSINSCIGAQVEGLSSFSKGYVSSVFNTEMDGNTYTEIYFEQTDDLDFRFTSGEQIRISNPLTGITIYGTIVPVMSSATISNPGTGYKTGDWITIYSGNSSIPKAYVSKVSSGSVDSISVTNPGTGYSVGDVLEFNYDDAVSTNISSSGSVQEMLAGIGNGAYAYISSVNTSGGVLSVTVKYGGKGYTKRPTVKRVFSDTGTGAIFVTNSASIGQIEEIAIIDFGTDLPGTPVMDLANGGDGNAAITANLGGICDYAPRWTNTNSFLSYDKYLQDNYYYQDYSYDVKYQDTFAEFKDAIKTLVHPAGMLMFVNMFLEIGPIDLTLGNLRNVGGKVYEDIVIYFERLLNLSIEWRHTHATRLSVTSDEEITILIESLVAVLGASQASLEKEKFNFPSYTQDDLSYTLDYETADWKPSHPRTYEYPIPNENYWEFPKTNAPMWHFDHVTFETVELRHKRSNIQPDPALEMLNIREELSGLIFGPTTYSINRERFNYPPYAADYLQSSNGTTESYMAGTWWSLTTNAEIYNYPGTNGGYWSAYTNTPMWIFENETFITMDLKKRRKIMPDPSMTIDLIGT